MLGGCGRREVVEKEEDDVAHVMHVFVQSSYVHPYTGRVRKYWKYFLHVSCTD